MLEMTGTFALTFLLYLWLLPTIVKISSLDVLISGLSALRDSGYDQLHS